MGALDSGPGITIQQPNNNTVWSAP